MCAGIITSSPGLNLQSTEIISKAAAAELTAKIFLHLRYFDNDFSNNFKYFPPVRGSELLILSLKI